MAGGWTYLITNKPNGVLYVGVTAHSAQRVNQHRRRSGSRFCARYGLTRPVLAEPHDTIEDTIRREKALNAWKRSWKVELIERLNPGWDDLFDRIG